MEFLNAAREPKLTILGYGYANAEDEQRGNSLWTTLETTNLIDKWRATESWHFEFVCSAVQRVPSTIRYLTLPTRFARSLLINARECRDIT